MILFLTKSNFRKQTRQSKPTMLVLRSSPERCVPDRVSWFCVHVGGAAKEKGRDSWEAEESV